MEDNQIERFERFYFREMTASEQADFNQKLQADENLRQEYGSFILAREALEQAEAKSLREQMNTWEADVKPGNMPEKPRRKSNRWGLLLFLLFLIVAVYLSCPISEVNSGSQISDWDAYAQVHLRGIERSVEDISLTQRLNQLYLDENFSGARDFIGTLDDSLRKQPKVKLIEALLMYQSQNFTAAKNKFEEILADRSAPFMVIDAATYFSLLSSARLNSCLSECQLKLKRLSEDDNFLYKNQASLLLHRLEARE